MKFDSQGLPYFNISDKGKKIIFHTPNNKNKKTNKSSFYELLTLKDYLIKYSHTVLDKDTYFMMLKTFKDTQDKITLTNLPIGYYEEKDTLKGTIIPYYKDSISLAEITESKNLDNLSKYYFHDDDKLHNLYILLNNILDILEELQNNGICYIDSNPSNFLIKDNQIKLIDFDPKYILYGLNNKNINATLTRFDDLVFYLHLHFQLDNLAIYKAKNFKTMHKHLVKLENKMRKR